MRVRVWIAGPEGPSQDFELVDPPRVGERLIVSTAGHLMEGIVVDVAWRLQAIERADVDLVVSGEPVGSVSLVDVFCGPPTEAARFVREATSADLAGEEQASHH